MLNIYSQIDGHADSPNQQFQQPRRNYLLIATILLVGLIVALFFMGPSIGLNLPCHGSSQPIFTNSTTQSLPLIPVN